MLGFGKKKTEEEMTPPPDSPALAAAKKVLAKKQAKDGSGPPPQEAQPALGGKKFTLKRVFLFLVLPSFVLALGWVGYTRFFSQTDQVDKKRIYREKNLAYVTLPGEMMKFSFERMPELYNALVAFNSEVILLDKEIARIEAVGQKYPDQQKIVDTEKKVWEKSKNTLVKEFSKIDKPVKEMYVLFQVNRDQGLSKVQEKAGDLVAAAENALATVREQTVKLKDRTPPVPEGMIRGTLHKLKSKFL